MASVVALSGCSGAPTPSATPDPSPSESLAPEAERPAPAFGGSCTDLADADSILAVAGIDLPLTTGGDPDAPLTSYSAATQLAGGLLTCAWGAADGSGPHVAVDILPRFAGDDFDTSAAMSVPGCSAFEDTAACGESLEVNGYWVDVSVRGLAGLDGADTRFAELVAKVTEVVAAAPVAPTDGPATPSALAEPLCTSAATLGTAFGVDESAIVEPGHGSESGIIPSALQRAGADGCPWDIPGFGAWEFWFLASGAWAFDEPLQPYSVDRGLGAFTLSTAEVAGAESARAGCAGEQCEAQLVVGDDLLIVISRAFDGDFVDQVEAVISAI